MSKVHTSAVVIIPPNNQWGSIQDIRNTHDRQINRWMPHITLLYPFIPKNDFPKVSRDFSEIVKKIDPFEISLTTFKFFKHGRQKYTMWLEPVPRELIMSLQAKILKIVPDCNDVNKFKNGFRPHLSVGQVSKKSKLFKTLNELQSSWEPLSFLLKKIYFISQEKSKASKFQVEETFSLKN